MNSAGPGGGVGMMMTNQGGRVQVQHNIAGAVAGGRIVQGVMISTGNPNPPQPLPRKPIHPPGGKLMRLRCRFRPMHDAYIKNGNIVEDDSDVIFVCGDGHQLKAHKVIMASSSKFFAKLFEDQTAVTAVVSVPDIKVDIMKLILQLTYRERVILTMKQIKDVGEFITIFGMAWTQFGYEEYAGDEKMSSLPMAPVPMKPVELPRTIIYLPRNPNQRPSGGSPQRLSAIHQNQQNGVSSPDEYAYQHQQQGSSNSQLTQQQLAERHSRKTKLTPRAVVAGEEMVEQDEEEDPENKMRDWMSKLGKRDSSAAGISPNVQMVKKIRTDPQPMGNAQEQQQQGNKVESPFSCTVCDGRFKSEMAWRWHEERHVGINQYKCQFCDVIVQTPKDCYIHEKEAHGFSGMKLQQQQQQASGGAQQGAQPQQASVGVNQTAQLHQRRVFVRPNQPTKFTSVNTGYSAVSKKIKMATLKKMQSSQQIRKPNFATKHPRIAIGQSTGSEFVDVKKIKQLHWLYVCQRCDNCADSVSKAQLHYDHCYPERDVEFEESVVKERQGFYGKSKCPLCPRRYPLNSGFMIHCGHQHQAYRRLFSHTGSQDDQLKCLNCKQIYPEPSSFHEHLASTKPGIFMCGGKDVSVEAEDGDPPALVQQQPKPKPPAKNPVGRPKSTNAPRPKRVESPIEHKASYKVQFHTPPKSARLANRAKAEASAEAAKAKLINSSFPAVDCPVCGEGEIADIAQHLEESHTDLKIDVSRVSSELLRCKHCTITFSICDLLDHKSCFDNKGSGSAPAVAEKEKKEKEGPTEKVDNGEASTSRRSSTGAGRPPTKPVITDVDTLPPGVGRSPIDRIEIDDLHSIQAIRSALQCGVCGKTSKRLGVVADCLRGHGVQRCSLCFNSYCSKVDYSSHLKRCHGSAGNKLKCPLCPKAFSNAGQTSGHMYSTHWLAILKENELASKTDSKGKNGPSAAGTDDAKKENSSGKTADLNGSSDQSFEEEGANDELKPGEDVEYETEDKDPLGGEEEKEDDDTTMQVEGSSGHDSDEEYVPDTKDDDDDVDVA